MANQEHLDFLKQGVEVWNQWREENPDIHPDLSWLLPIGLPRLNSLQMYNWARLSWANLSEVDFRWSNLPSLNLSRTNLQGANLAWTNLHQANLSGADLSRANLSGTFLHKADLSGADLSRANLTMSILTEANFVDAILTKASLECANLGGADLTRADLQGANLTFAMLAQTRLIEANLTNSFVYGISAWDVQLERAMQSSLIITPHDQPTIEVDNLEVAQLIYLLIEHKKLRVVLNSVIEKGVLLLGRFNEGGLDLLQAIAARLREMKYLPIIFDFDRPVNRNLTETIITLVGLSRFVIADLSGRSVANELRSTVPHFKIPFVPIIEESRKKEVYSMFSDFLETDWVLPPVMFTSKDHLMELLPSKIIKPAEMHWKKRRKYLKRPEFGIS